MPRYKPEKVLIGREYGEENADEMYLYTSLEGGKIHVNCVCDQRKDV